MAESGGSRLRLGLLRQSESLITNTQGESVNTSRQSENNNTNRHVESVNTSRLSENVSNPRLVESVADPRQGDSVIRQGLHRQARGLLNNPTVSSDSDGGRSVSEQNQSENQSSSNQFETVTDLRHTLASVKLLQEFRLFLRIKFDRNKSGDPEYKKMGEQWLDFVRTCEEVFELPEEDKHRTIDLMVEIGSQYLGKPPDGYNMALQNQLNRKELILHCKALAEKVSTDPDTSLLRDGYEYVFTKLEQKHDIFRKSYRPTTMLAALVCALS